MTDSEHVLLGGVVHETNTFAEEPTDREDFSVRKEYFGEELVEQLTGTDTTAGGALSVADANGLDIEPTVFAHAMPGGRVADETFEFYLGKLTSPLRNKPGDIDGVVLTLHGAMVTETYDDAEGEILRRIRELFDGPIVVTLDLHAHVTEPMVIYADGLFAYETYPHMDMGETGRRATEALTDLLQTDLTTSMAKYTLPLVTSGPRQNTIVGPMAKVMDHAAAVEDRDGVHTVNIVPGFMQADIPYLGFSVSVISERSAEHADDVAAELAATVWNERENLIEKYPSPAAAADQLREEYEYQPSDSPVVVADAGDNPGHGASADGTTLLQHIFELDISNIGIASVYDPEAVSAALDAGIDTEVALSVGGKRGRSVGPTLEVTGCIKTISDGQHINEGPVGTGVEQDFGRTVVMECGPEQNINLLISENRVQPYDTRIWRRHGIVPEEQNILVLKSQNHFRGSYNSFAKDILIVDTPGLGAISPDRFKYQNVGNPFYPKFDVPTDELSWRSEPRE